MDSKDMSIHPILIMSSYVQLVMFSRAKQATEIVYQGAPAWSHRIAASFASEDCKGDGLADTIL